MVRSNCIRRQLRSANTATRRLLHRKNISMHRSSWRSIPANFYYIWVPFFFFKSQSNEMEGIKFEMKLRWKKEEKKIVALPIHMLLLFSSMRHSAEGRGTCA